MLESAEYQDLKEGEIYNKFAKRVYNVLGPSEKKLRAKKEKEKDGVKKAKEEYLRQKAKWDRVKGFYTEDNEKKESVKKGFEKSKKEYETKKRVFEQKQFYDSVNFVGLDLTVEETMIFSIFVSATSFFVLLGLTIVSFMFFSSIIFRIFLVATFVVPLLSFTFLSNYPEMLAERKKVKTLAKTPEAINYLSISMRLNPSLEKAISFTADNSDEPVASGFRKILWNIYLNKYTTIEGSMVSFARKWGEWNEDFKLALYSVRQASLEKTKDGLNRSLDRANRIIRDGAMNNIEEFAASLSTPTTVLFALGILLPLVIGAMLPMFSMGTMDFDIQTLDDGVNGMAEATRPSIAPLIILMMNVIFPVVAFAYSFSILGKRPGTSSPPRIPPTLTTKKKKRLLMSCSALGLLLIGIGVYLLSFAGGSSYVRAIYALPILWGIAAPISIYMFLESREMKKKRKEILKLEKQFPDALFQLGSQMIQGKSLENSMKSISESLRGSEAGDLFGKIITRMAMKGESLNKTLFGKDGLLKKIPSRTVRVSLKALARISEKDPEESGKTLIEISSYQKEMAKMDNDIKNELAPSIDTMNATGIIFAPLVMGITAALYIFLSDISAEIGTTGAEMVDSYLFVLIVGFYLIQILIVIIYFSVGIQYGGDKIERNYSIGTTLPVAMLLFSIAVIVTQMAFGPV